MKMKVVLALLAAVFVSTLATPKLLAVNIGVATGGTGISADKAANAAVPAWTSLSTFTIAETGGNKGELTNGTFVLNAPAGFEFNAAQKPTIGFTASKDLTGASLTITSNAITITLTGTTVGAIDTVTVGGVGTNALQVRPTAGSPLAANGIIFRVAGGLPLSGVTAGSAGTSFGNLTEVVGNAAKLAFTQSPSSASVGVPFGTQPIVRTQDQFGNNSVTALAASLTVTVSLTAGTGPLVGTTTANIGTTGGNGSVTFANLQVDTSGNDKQLTASSSLPTSGLSSVFTVSAGNQTINSFPSVGTKTFGVSDFTVSATASSGLPVTFSVQSGLASVSGNTVTITGAGSVTLRASQVGDTNWNSTFLDQTFTVNKATPVITWSNPSAIVYGAALDNSQLNASTPVAGNFVYTPPVGTVLDAGASQSLSTLFTPTDTANYSNATANVSIDVLKADQTNTFGALSDKVTTDAPFTVSATASSGLPVSFSIFSGPASVSGNTITLTGATGLVTVRALQGGSANYNAAAAVDQSFNVNNGTPTITWNTPADIAYGTALSATQLSATTSVAGTYTYNPTNGTVLDIGVGQTLSVTFVPDDTNSYSQATANVLINVVKATPEITWANPADIIYGDLLSATQLNASTVVPGTLTYSQTNGTLLNAGIGEVLNVSFVPDDATRYNSTSTNVLINVAKATPVVAWSAPADIIYNTPLSGTQLNASTIVAGTLSYSPPSGTILNAGSRTLSVNFVPDDSANYNNASNSVSINVLKASTTITWGNPVDITYGTLLSGTQLNASASVGGTLVYSPTTNATLTAGTNILSVTFTPTDTANYDGTNATVSIVVNKATPVLTWNTPSSITYGTALSASQLNAGANVGGTFTYNPTNGTVLTAGIQTLSADFTPTDTTNYNNLSTNVSITVLKSVPVITWSTPASISYGTLLSTNQLNATTVVAGTLSYSPDLGAQLNAGTQNLSVVFTPNDSSNYESATNNVSLVVTKVTPTITWAAPSDIVYGTALSGTQLNATSSVPGTLSYNPTNGAVLNAGTQTLNVSFVPSDTTNYNNASGSVSLNVSKAPVSITWANPADITYGTALSGTQLNATASQPGTLLYSPAAPVVLQTGNSQTLSVSFTPTSANYSNASANVSINVLKAPLTVKANDTNRIAGASNPTFTATYTGFVNGDSVASLTTPVTLTTIADNLSPAGFYDIVPSAATSGNYDITFVSGTLTVSPTSLVVSTLAGGNWSAPGTWVGNVVPTAADNAVVSAGATVSVDVAAECFSLTLSNSAALAPTFNVLATKSLVVGSGSGLVTIGQNLTPTNGARTTLLNVAGTLNCGNVNMVARRSANNDRIHAVLRLSDAAAVVTVTNNVSQDRNVVTGGLLAQVEFTAAGQLKLGGGFLSIGQGGSLLAGTGTMEYNGPGNQTIAPFTYNNLTLSGSGTKTGSAAVTNGATGTFSLKDSVAYAGATPTYTAGSTLLYARTGAQITGNELPAVPPATWNLSISNAAGVTLSQSINVSGTLSLITGALNTGNNTVTANGTTTRTSGYVVGNLKKNFVVGAGVTRNFQVGLASGYNPVTITVANVSVTGSLTVKANAGDHSAIGTANLDASKSVNANWSVTTDGVLGFDSYSGNFNFNAADLDSGASASLLVVGDYSSGSWSYPTVAARTATSVQVNGLTGFSDFQLAEVANKTVPTITWSNPADIVYGTALDGTQLNATASVPGSFVYSPVAGTFLNAGASQPLSATFTPTDSANYSNVTTTVFINVSKLNQTITFNALSDKLTSDAPFVVSASSSSGLPVSFSIFSGPANISSDTVTLTGAAGTVIVRASQVGDSNYNAAGDVDQSFVVTSNATNKILPTITWNTPADIAYGTGLSTNELNATADVAGTLVYSPVLETVLPLGTNQLLSVSFTPTDTNTYSSATTNVFINVVKATPSITWSAPADITYGTALSALQLNASNALAGTFVYSPTNGTVLSAGTNQTLSVSFIPDDTTNYNNASASVAINVLKATPVITWSTPASIVYNTALSAAQLNASVDTDGTLSYSPDTGAVLPAGTNTLTVNFVPNDTTNYNNTSATVEVVVAKATPVITWSNPSSIVYGTALSATQLNASADVGGTLSYTPDTGAVLGAGTNTLTVNFVPTDSANYNNTSATVELVVTKATPVITWSTPASIVYNTALSATQLNASANVGGTLSYSPDTGAVLGAGTNTLTVNFVPTDSANYNDTSASVALVVTKATPVITWSTPASIVYNTALSATQLNASADVGGTLSYTPDTGAVLGAGTNTLTVNFVPTDSANYNNASATVDLVVTKASSSITWSAPADITYGTTLSGLQLNATNALAGTFTYSPTNGTLLNAGTNQALSVSFVPDDTTNYSNTSASVAINVLKATPSITWTNPAAIVYNTGLSATQLNASVNVAGTLSYSPDTGAVLPVGTNTLTVSFVPTDSTNYNNAAANVTLVVTPASTVVTWANPASIVYGTALTTNELNASANTAGTFTYTPTLGTVLNAGTNSLRVSFVPTDTANYQNASNNVAIVVTKRVLTLVGNNFSREYGLTNPVFTGVLSGVRVGDNISGSYSTAARTSANVGVYVITATLLDPNSKLANYTTSITNGTLTITPAPLSVVVDDKTKVYGSTNPIFTGAISGIRNGDAITNTYACTATNKSPVGTYPITYTLTGFRLTNYTAIGTNGVLTITKSTPIVTLVSAGNPASIGASVVFSATVSATNNIPVTNGVVQFVFDSTNRVTPIFTNGVAHLVWHFAYLGNHSVQATYLGDANRNSSSSSILTQSITPLPVDVLAVIQMPDGSALVRFVGDGVNTYTVQASTDLLNWSPVGPASVGIDGLLEASDATAASQPYRFYRAVK